MASRRKVCRRQRRQQLKKDVDAEYVSSDWAGLPDSLLEEIIERLPVIDCIAFSYVCKPWRRVFVEHISHQPTCGFPLLLMAGQQDKETRTCISALLQNQVWELALPQAYGRFCWGSYQDWLILVKDLGHCSIDITLLNPFSGRKIDLPQASNIYHEMVLSGLPSEENLVCMLVPSRERRELAFWTPGAQSWHKYSVGVLRFEDAIFYNGSFYLLAHDYNIWEIDATNIFSTIRRDDSSIANASTIKTQFHEVEMSERPKTDEIVVRYLVGSCGELLLVNRVFKKEGILETQDFEMYKLDVSHKVWMKLENLGDRMLFVGKCCSRSFSAKQLGVGMSNCIYFANDRLWPYVNEWDVVTSLRSMEEYGDLEFDGNRFYHSKCSGRRDWGTFSLGNENRGSFSFRGKQATWVPIWLTAPLWWCCTKQ